MDAEYGEAYARLYRDHWWWRAREVVVLRELRAIRAPADHRALLDVGCGDGLLLERLSELGPAYGIEPDASLVSPDGPHRDRIRVGYFDGSYKTPEPVSTILMLDVLEHIQDPVATLRAARRVLDPDGALLITVPAHRALWTTHDDLNHHVTRFSSNELRATLEQGGFEVRRMHYMFRWLVGPKLLVRAIESVRHPKPSVPGVPIAPLNAMLYALSRAEDFFLERLLGGRVDVPGSSLLAVAVPRQ